MITKDNIAHIIYTEAGRRGKTAPQYAQNFLYNLSCYDTVEEALAETFHVWGREGKPKNRNAVTKFVGCDCWFQYSDTTRGLITLYRMKNTPRREYMRQPGSLNHT